ncbi:MAG: UvrD-helicase domain-containing protein [Chloroflexota bacterium]|nr:UvrD-helicase domain-containing protein [Chloroflexota bacterium]
MLDLSKLNPEQREAVTATEGPLLVVAGPGSGKTAVIAARAAYIIDQGLAEPSAVLAVTFTNKAGRELKRRLASVLGESARQVWAGTFHAFALRMLRQWGGHFGFDPDHLSVYADQGDRRTALTQALKELGLDPKGQPREALLQMISRAKDRLLWPKDVAGRDPELSAVYEAYQGVLRRRNALDFDDFLLFAVRLLEERADVARSLRCTHRYILVDEFQDVNHAQHRLLTLLAAEHGNLCVVGDPVQNLFSWRGSDIRYLLEFQRDYPNARVISLEQNYRSTQVILAVANALSAALRYGRRNLWTANPPGLPVVLRATDDPQAEAAFVVAEVQRLIAEGAVGSPGDCAVLYRTNAQARELELACLEAGLPYSVRGNNDFLARKEIRDLLAYLRLVHNPQDVVALGRVVNTPPRRLATLERRIRAGEELTLGRLEAEFPCGLKGDRSRKALRDFLEVVAVLRSMADAPPGPLIEAVLELTGYRTWLRGQEDGEARLANLESFRGFAERSEAQDLAEFLDEVSLASDLETGSDPEGLALSTIHAVKGLEWPVVFVAGLEDGLLPHARALDGLEGEGSALEEELRLCYVAVTRAVDRVYLTYARRRPGNGRSLAAMPSRFLRRMPIDLLERRAA